MAETAGQSVDHSTTRSTNILARSSAGTNGEILGKTTAAFWVLFSTPEIADPKEKLSSYHLFNTFSTCINYATKYPQLFIMSCWKHVSWSGQEKRFKHKQAYANNSNKCIQFAWSQKRKKQKWQPQRIPVNLAFKHHLSAQFVEWRKFNGSLSEEQKQNSVIKSV